MGYISHMSTPHRMPLAIFRQDGASVSFVSAHPHRASAHRALSDLRNAFGGRIVTDADNDWQAIILPDGRRYAIANV